MAKRVLLAEDDANIAEPITFLLERRSKRCWRTCPTSSCST